MSEGDGHHVVAGAFCAEWMSDSAAPTLELECLGGVNYKVLGDARFLLALCSLPYKLHRCMLTLKRSSGPGCGPNSVASSVESGMSRARRRWP